MINLKKYTWGLSIFMTTVMKSPLSGLVFEGRVKALCLAHAHLSLDIFLLVFVLIFSSLNCSSPPGALGRGEIHTIK